MAENVMAPKTLFINLPSELREEIMRYLLVSPRAPDTGYTELGRFPCTACNECALFARKRNEMHCPCQIHSAILLTCRDLYTDALEVLKENRMVAVHDPNMVSQGSLEIMRLGHWRVRTGLVSSIQPIITFTLPRCTIPVLSPRPQLYSTYLFDIQDLDLVARYLLR